MSYTPIDGARRAAHDAAVRHRAIVACSLALAACAATKPAAVVAPSPPSEERRHRATFWYFVENLEPDPADGKPPAVLLWVALPQSRNGQTVTLGAFDPPPTEILDDPVGGNRVAFWRVAAPPRGGLVFRYDAEIANRPIHVAIDPARVRRPAPDAPEVKRYTVSEPWLEASDAISAEARRIVGGEENPYLQARKVFDWIVANVTYDYPGIADRGVTRAFRERKGDCGEFSHIFETMMRSLGVPARSVVANWYQGSGHAWAEVFLTPYGWVPVDTSGAQLVQSGLKGQLSDEKVRDFMATRGIPSRDPEWLFGNLYPNRVEVFVGENVAFTGRTPGASRTFQFMQPGGSGAWPPAIAFEGLTKKAVSEGFFLFDDEAGDAAKARARADEELIGAYLAAGLNERALELVGRALPRKPRDGQLLFSLGQAHFKLGHWAEAIDGFARSLDGEGGGSVRRTRDTWAHILSGMAEDARGRRDAAVAHYRAALQIGADHQGSLATARHFLEAPFDPRAKR